MIKRGCLCRYSTEPRPVFAVWTEQVRYGGAKLAVCREHLDLWLDAADDRPGWEPEALDFVVSRPPATTDRLGIGDWLLIEAARRIGAQVPAGTVLSPALLVTLAEPVLAREALA